MRRILAFLLLSLAAVAPAARAAVPQTIVIDGVNDFLPANLFSDDALDTQTNCGAGIFPMDLGKVYVTNDANFLYVGIEFAKTCFCDMNLGIALDVGTAGGGVTDAFGRKIGWANVPFKPDWMIYDVTPTNCNTFNFEQIYENVGGAWQTRGTAFNPSYGTGSNGLGIFDADTFKEFKLPLASLGLTAGTVMHLELWVTQEGATKGPLDALSSDDVQMSTVSGTTFDTAVVIEMTSMLPYTVLNAVDADPPTVSSAKAVDFALQVNKQFALLTTKVDVVFNEPVDATTSQSTANYAYTGPAPVRSITSAVRDLLTPDVVHLTLSPPINANAAAYAISANGVKDLANNTIVSNGTTNKGSFFIQNLSFNGNFALGLCSGQFATADTFAVEGSLAPLTFSLCDNGLLLDANADSVYTLTVPFALPVNTGTGKGEADLEWKFSNKCTTFEPLGGNRTFHITSDSGSTARLTAAWNNDDPSLHTARAVDVIFKVDATRRSPLISDVITLMGSAAPLAFTQPGTPMLDNGIAPDAVAGDMIYTARVTFPACALKAIGWKVDFKGTIECAGQGDRGLVLDDAVYSTLNPMILPARGIDRCEVTDKPLTVVFAVRADQFYPPSAPTDTVAIRGNGAPLSFDFNQVIMRDNGVAPDGRADDGVFTRSVTFPDSTPQRIEFKYWTAGDFECTGFSNRVLLLNDVLMSSAVPVVRLEDVYNFCTELTGVPPGIEPGNGTSFGILRPVMPNPVSRSARFGFELNRAGRVALDVYDVTGRRVARLLETELAAGVHTAAWDGRDARGVRLGPGLYIYQLSMGGQRLSRRLIMTH